MPATLLILAAGLGSRYGASKQVDELGPKGAWLMDYAIYDAVRAGFGRIVFVISAAMAADFTQSLAAKYGPRPKIPFDFVIQSLTDLPPGVILPPERTKPWGTGHAVLAARQVITEPFAVINADDYYGPEAFNTVVKVLGVLGPASREAVMVGYRLARTLSAHGSVNRGVCQLDRGYLTSVVERESIHQVQDKIVAKGSKGEAITLSPDALVSMNLWGFAPQSVFPILTQQFVAFSKANRHLPSTEFYIPWAVDRAIAAGDLRVRVVPTRETWMGLTHAADRDGVRAMLTVKIAAGTYPENLFA